MKLKRVMTNQEAINQIIELANELQILPNTPKGEAIKKAIEALKEMSLNETTCM